MNRTWSVFTGPCLVVTVVPSISGSRSRCTPSRDDVAAPAFARAGADLVDLVDEDDAVVLAGRDGLAAPPSPGRAACRSPRPSATSCDSATVILRFLVRPPKALPNISPRLSTPICAPGMPGMSKVGMPPPAVGEVDLDLACRPARRRAAACGTSGASRRGRSRRPGRRARAPRRPARPWLAPACAAARGSWRWRPRPGRGRSARRRGRHSRPR